MNIRFIFGGTLAALALAACGAGTAAPSVPTATVAPSATPLPSSAPDPHIAYRAVVSNDEPALVAADRRAEDTGSNSPCLTGYVTGNYAACRAAIATTTAAAQTLLSDLPTIVPADLQGANGQLRQGLTDYIKAGMLSIAGIDAGLRSGSGSQGTVAGNEEQQGNDQYGLADPLLTGATALLGLPYKF